MTLEELRQQHIDNLDYFIEQVEDNPLDIGIYHYYIDKTNELNATFAKTVIEQAFKGEE